MKKIFLMPVLGITIAGSAFADTQNCEYLMEDAPSNAETITLDANWSPKNYNIQYDLNIPYGGYSGAYNVISEYDTHANYDTTINLPTVTRRGYSFVRWKPYDGSMDTVLSGNGQGCVFPSWDSVQNTIYGDASGSNWYVYGMEYGSSPFLIVGTSACSALAYAFTGSESNYGIDPKNCYCKITGATRCSSEYSGSNWVRVGSPFSTGSACNSDCANLCVQEMTSAGYMSMTGEY